MKRMVFLALIGLLVLSHTCEGRPRRGGPGRARSALREARAQLKEAQREAQAQLREAQSDAQAQLREAQEFRGCPRPSRGSCSDGTCDEGTCTEIAECTDRTVSYCKCSADSCPSGEACLPLPAPEIPTQLTVCMNTTEAQAVQAGNCTGFYTEAKVCKACRGGQRSSQRGVQREGQREVQREGQDVGQSEGRRGGRRGGRLGGGRRGPAPTPAPVPTPAPAQIPALIPAQIP